MSWLLFVDECGVDRRHTPYEVLAGVAVRDREIWPLVQRIHEAEVDHFGQRISEGRLELKAKKLLKRKTYRLARQMAEFSPAERLPLAKSCLQKGAALPAGAAGNVTRAELAALGQAKLAFVERVFELCAEHRVQAMASIVPRSAERSQRPYLRKDYAYLFERFYYFLEDRVGVDQGLVVFDELERSRAHILVDQMGRYFRDTAIGKKRAQLVIPEPFFVHSDLTTLVQIADLVAYVIAFGVRVHSMRATRRPELDPLARRVLDLRYRTTRDFGEKSDVVVWSFAVINDLRPQSER